MKLRASIQTLILVMALLVTAVAIVTVRHESRQRFAALEAQQAEMDRLNVEWGRLQLEHATWAEAGRVESAARTELGLVSKSPSQVMVVVE